MPTYGQTGYVRCNSRKGLHRMFDSPAKDPRKAAGGRKGMASRWGPQRVVRLDGLTAAQRGLVVALIDNMKEPAAVAMPAGSETGGTHDATPSS